MSPEKLVWDNPQGPNFFRIV